MLCTSESPIVHGDIWITFLLIVDCIALHRRLFLLRFFFCFFFPLVFLFNSKPNPRVLSRMQLVTIATSSLNQWALDFDGNLSRIVTSCLRAKEAGATLRTGPELEISGYGCEDHFLEIDTFQHSWESLAAILRSEATVNLLCDFGMPIVHRGVRYNCRVYCLNRQILLIRPKINLCDRGNNRESRYFSPWIPKKSGELEIYTLPEVIRAVNGQSQSPFGVAVIATRDITLATEFVEEIRAGVAPHSLYANDGVDIILNNSADHHELQGLKERVELLQGVSKKYGGVYVYSNQIGCDGSKLYYDGSSMIVANGQCFAQGGQFSLAEVDVVTATIDLDQVRTFRGSNLSRVNVTSEFHRIPHVYTEFALCPYNIRAVPSSPKSFSFFSLEEEMGLGAACWLWDFLRRSGASGFFLPLSGGADSSATATIVGIMCHLVYKTVVKDGEKHGYFSSERMDTDTVNPESKDKSVIARNPTNFRDLNSGTDITTSTTSTAVQVHFARGTRPRTVSSPLSEIPVPSSDETHVLSDLRRIVGDPQYIPESAEDICNRIFHTAYMATSNSSQATRNRSNNLASEIGTYHLVTHIDILVKAMLWVFATFVSFGKLPSFSSLGGTKAEDLALQNLQARMRMVLAYFLAQLLPWVRRKKGFLLVLGSGNGDETLRGYYTKYDCSSADINPIGTFSKVNIKAFLRDSSKRYNYVTLQEIAGAAPSAELRPNATGIESNDPFSINKRSNVASSTIIPSDTKADLQAKSTSASPDQTMTRSVQDATQPSGTNSTIVEKNAETFLSDMIGSTNVTTENVAPNEPTQLDEEEMSMTYDELQWYGKLRKEFRCGPFSMYSHLLFTNEGPWAGLAPREIAGKVKTFFFYYSLNRHKVTTITPSYFADKSACEDSRYDHRPFLYNTGWCRQFDSIDADVIRREAADKHFDGDSSRHGAQLTLEDARDSIVHHAAAH